MTSLVPMHRFRPHVALAAALSGLISLPALPENGDQQSWAAAAALPHPMLFAPGEISTGDFESHPCFTADGGELFFVKSNTTFTSWTIVVARHESGKWSTPVVAPFSGQYNDADPFLTSDGRRMYFISDRPRTPGDARMDMDIWYVDRTQTGWSAPAHVGSPVNSTASEWFPNLAADGTLYFGSSREGGKGRTDLYRASPKQGGFDDPQNLGDAVNTPADEYEPLVSPDQKLLVFMASGRRDSLGAGDLYASRLVDDAWKPAKNLGPAINTSALEISPYVTPDRKFLFFSSSRQSVVKPPRPRSYEQLLGDLRGPGNGLGDLYRVDLDAALKGLTP